MNQATNVNIVPSYGQRGDLHFSQYDVGRTATINLYAVNEAYTIPVGATVKIQATKPSGLGFDVACTFSGSVVTVVSTETMTAEAGRFPAELHIIDNSDVIGTANFMFVVEASPHPDGTVDGDAEEVVNEIKALVLQSEGYALGTQDGVPVDSSSPYYHNNAKYYAENVALSEEFKQALLNCFQNVAWIGNDGQDYYDALANALNPSVVLVSISAVYTQGGTVYDTDSLDSLKSDLVVTAHYDDSSSEAVLGYELSGTLEVGTSTITVSYGGKTTTFNVTVSESWDFEWDYTKGLPNNNGMTLTSNSPTISLESNGLSVTTVNNSSSYAMYKYENVSSSPYSKTIEEYVFTITTQTAQSGGGIRTYVGLGGTGASVKKVAQLLFSENGIQYLSGSSWATLSSTPFATGTEYTVRMEQTASDCIIFVNGTEIATLSTFSEQVAYPQFGVYRGAAALIKSFKLKFEA